MRAVTLTERVETFGRTFERGAVLFVAAEFECVANLVDADGVPRISHLPVERFVDGVGGRVVTDGRTVWKFGPDVSDFSPAAIAAELDRWNAWLARVRAFFVDTISQSA